MIALEKRVGELADDVREYDRSLRALRTKRYKYIRGSDGTQELYDVRVDPNEMNNIADSKPKTVMEFDDQLNEWLDTFEHAESTGEVTMDDDTKSRLEDLGYLQ
jgi:arylsulfatase A-like enzyme